MRRPQLPRRGTPQAPHAFTLVELIVVILILGILAAIAVIGFSNVTGQAKQTAARVELRQLAQTVLVKATSDDSDLLNRELVLAALADSYAGTITDALTAADGWTVLGAGQIPDAPGEVSVGFRSNDTDPYTDAPGTQALLSIGDDTTTYSQTLQWRAGGLTLGEVTQAPVKATHSPFGAMWVWDNSLTADQDNRGTGYAAATPQQILTFARQQNLTRVHIGAPWVSNEGPISAWMDETTKALADGGMEVGVLGGDPGWLADPSLAARWARDAVSTRPVSYVELSLEPWTLPAWNADRATTVAQWTAAIDAVKAALPEGVGLSLDAPYWLATTPAPGGGTLFDVIVDRADAISIVTFVDHAEQFDGIIALSAPARAAAEAAGIPYFIGLETDTPAVAGGAAFTFYDEGQQVLTHEAGLVEQALAGDPMYQGVAVEHYRAWRSLIANS